MFLRRRSVPPDLAQPLLGDGAPPPPPKPRGLLARLLAALAAARRAVGRLLAPLLPRRWRPLALTPAGEAALHASRTAAATPYDNDAHASLLPALWAACFPDGPPPPPPPLVSPAWVDAGWQGPDPRTDLRGGGAAAIAHVLHLHRVHPPLFARLRSKARPCAYLASDEYPFAAAGVGVSFAIATAAGLHAAHADAPTPAPAEGAPRDAAARGYAALLETVHATDAAAVVAAHGGRLPPPYDGGRACDAAALALAGSVYAAAFEALDDAWAGRRGGYMRFGGMAADLRAALAGALADRPPSVEALTAGVRRRMGV